jgi:hypothetical protein
MAESPVGTIERGIAGFSRPYGTQSQCLSHPALKRWAILNRPLRGRQTIFISRGELEKVHGARF